MTIEMPEQPVVRVVADDLKWSVFKGDLIEAGFAAEAGINHQWLPDGSTSDLSYAPNGGDYVRMGDPARDRGRGLVMWRATHDGVAKAWVMWDLGEEHGDGAGPPTLVPSSELECVGKVWRGEDEPINPLLNIAWQLRRLAGDQRAVSISAKALALADAVTALVDEE